MKKALSYCILFFAAVLIAGCKKDGYGNYPGGTVNPLISVYDLKSIFKESPVKLSQSTMFGSSKITGIVISDHSENNLPEGLLILQNAGRLNQNRGIAINIGAAAAGYVPGDSVVVTIEGGTMERVDGILQITGLASTTVEKKGSGKNIYTPVVGDVTAIAQNPDVYENTLVAITNSEFNPPATTGETFAGDKSIDNGSGSFSVHTENDAAFASKTLPFLASYIGVVLRQQDVFKLWPRKGSDIIVLSDKPPVIAPVVITGFLNNAIGGDANYEYIQLMATKDIDFSVTNMSVVTCNNAGSTGAPVMGWAIGGVRSYKFNLTSGTVTKGSYFYVGGNKVINGAASTDISVGNWIVSRTYSTVEGDGFGRTITNLLANSGNPAGIAVFNTIDVDSSTVPVDVIFFGGTSTSNTFAPGDPPAGYKITNTEYYEAQNTAVPTLDAQPLFLMGTNTFMFPLINDEAFRKLGGVYNIRSGKWQTKRTMTNLELPATSVLSDIETGGTTLSEDR
ncbi:DUF5689 domain-containing protein [Niabella yanshanensis]|uniref:DUF5689 domain-containing protein n=1 Tax=Niabella yanshanensis TaxID=577386 RepID=A0ABZ0W348_9BACT|nr:DUF5689 domain-containing protein [Niabella yanshanensis]WQD36912.1 DUF5689 domain-containing protein [Niabella yanshanensis]